MATNNSKKTSSSSANKKTAKSGKLTGQPSAASKAKSKKQSPTAETVSRFDSDPDSIGNQIVRFSLFAAGILFFIFLFFTDMSAGVKTGTGPVGYGICWLIFGLLGSSAYLIPFLCIYLSLFWRRCLTSGTLLMRIMASLALLLLIASMFQLKVQASASPVTLYHFSQLWKDGVAHRGGGLLGGVLGGLFYLLLKGVSWVILIFLLIADIMLLSEITPNALARFFKKLAKSMDAWLTARREEAQKAASDKPPKKQKALPEPKVKPEPEPEDGPNELPARKRKIFGIEEEKPPLPQMEVQPLDMQEIQVRDKAGDPIRTETITPVYVNQASVPLREPTVRTSAPQSVSELNLTDIYYSPEKDEAADRLGQTFTDRRAQQRQSEFNTAELEVQEDLAPWEETAPVLTPEEEEIADLLLDTTRAPLAEDTLSEVKEKLYQFPPLTLLKQNTDTQAADYSDELQKKGEKLVSTLKSFRVDTEIVNISHGPTITRYELVPKVGVRVRAIANLVDDIALNLETTGVRVEAPIPGKSAVGIEVPNKHPMTVYLRELLENPAFAQAKSKVTAALGMDVAGQPVFVDIAKMPHLLIAGATGMGKSVCINSLLMSLLYKATPDEVKLILIDPKKVELNVYNKLPHLLVPVVNAPKKAAGSLSWAVGEMERRFELIEEVGVRDIKGYNQITADDPSKEFLPHIIIIIDELADLMMTAPDDVEESICRIAQKARAAGMHLIIGTQRPSVNVITGLIKANIPTRIAFTVTSQIDSRTIIDMAGAEKLIGRGDMLYSPVGALKPIRIQGSFVSDKEVEAVCDFIRAQVGEGEYDTSVIEQIDKNAEQCGQKKKGSADISADEGGDIDPKFDEAVSVALEMGKISTSLLQRRLSLGYGRAAKIIDRMEQCGIVGPQEGSKPRNLLISASDWNEIKMRSED